MDSHADFLKNGASPMTVASYKNLVIDQLPQIIHNHGQGINLLELQSASQVISTYSFTQTQCPQVFSETKLVLSRGDWASLVPKRNPDFEGIQIDALFHAQMTMDEYDTFKLGADLKYIQCSREFVGSLFQETAGASNSQRYLQSTVCCSSHIRSLSSQGGPNAFVVFVITPDATKIASKLAQLERDLTFCLARERLRRGDMLDIGNIVALAGFAAPSCQIGDVCKFIEKNSLNLPLVSTLMALGRLVFYKKPFSPCVKAVGAAAVEPDLDLQIKQRQLLKVEYEAKVAEMEFLQKTAGIFQQLGLEAEAMDQIRKIKSLLFN